MSQCWTRNGETCRLGEAWVLPRFDTIRLSLAQIRCDRQTLTLRNNILNFFKPTKATVLVDSRLAVDCPFYSLLVQITWNFWPVSILRSLFYRLCLLWSSLFFTFLSIFMSFNWMSKMFQSGLSINSLKEFFPHSQNGALRWDNIFSDNSSVK